MPIDRDKEELLTGKKYDEKEKRKRKRMHMSGKSVFELQRLIKETSGKRITKLNKKQ